MKKLMENPRLAAIVALLLTIPFFALNTIVGNQIEPFFSLIRPGPHTSPVEYPLFFTALFLFPIGSLIALCPMFKKGADGKRVIYPLNILLAVFLVGFFLMVFTAMSQEIYQCDVLKIKNCD